MELKTGAPWSLRGICALLLLTACCFRTAAVLWSRESPELPPEYESFLFASERTQGELWEPTESGQRPRSPLLFSDLSNVDIQNGCGAVFDEESLFEEPLSIPLSREPCVLIVHTHGSEAYRECDNYRSTDPQWNMVSVGARIAERLKAAGIPTLQDTTLHDVTAGYNQAYGQAADSIEAYLEQYPSIQLVIDVHRDATAGEKGQEPLLAELEGEKAARLMLVVGTPSSERPNERWEDNLSLAMKLQSYCTGLAPGMMRQTSLRGSPYNQHLAAYSLLLEVGSAGNSLEEALLSASFIGDCIAQLLLAYGE